MFFDLNFDKTFINISENIFSSLPSGLSAWKEQENTLSISLFFRSRSMIIFQWKQVFYAFWYFLNILSKMTSVGWNMRTVDYLNLNSPRVNITIFCLDKSYVLSFIKKNTLRFKQRNQKGSFINHVSWKGTGRAFPKSPRTSIRKRGC